MFLIHLFQDVPVDSGILDFLIEVFFKENLRSVGTIATFVLGITQVIKLRFKLKDFQVQLVSIVLGAGLSLLAYTQDLITSEDGVVSLIIATVYAIFIPNGAGSYKAIGGVGKSKQESGDAK
jgi:hypothetical protein